MDVDIIKNMKKAADIFEWRRSDYRFQVMLFFL
jgi:hypothetical protein